MIVIIGVLIILGCFLDSIAILFIVTPVIFPIVSGFGYDPIWFGIIMVMVVEFGLITPPYGLLLFVTSGVTGVPLRAIVREIMPFLYVAIVALLIITFVPEVVLWLPRLFGYEG